MDFILLELATDSSSHTPLALDTPTVIPTLRLGNTAAVNADTVAISDEKNQKLGPKIREAAQK